MSVSVQPLTFHSLLSATVGRSIVIRSVQPSAVPKLFFSSSSLLVHVHSSTADATAAERGFYARRYSCPIGFWSVGMLSLATSDSRHPNNDAPRACNPLSIDVARRQKPSTCIYVLQLGLNNMFILANFPHKKQLKDKRLIKFSFLVGLNH